LLDRGHEQVALDPVEGGSCLDRIALREQHGLKIAGHAGAHLDASDRLDPADEVQRLLEPCAAP
jgi:hypothetical protein